MAEIILPSEENEETPQAPELNIDKPTVNSKVITIEFEAKKTNKVSTKDTNQQLYTTDTDAWFEFKETSLEGANGTYSVVFRNRHDGSIFQRTGDVVNGVAYYKIPHQEIRHAGAWRGQIVYALSNGDTTSREFDYDVKGHILDGKDVREIVVEDFETLMSQLRSMKDNAESELAGLTQELRNTTDTAEQNETDRQVFFDDLVEDIDELQANYQELLDTGVLQTNINTKLEALEEEYAPKLTEVTAQLAQTDNNLNQKVGNGKLATMADMGQDVKEALTGGSVSVVGKDTVLEENIVDGQVTVNKTDFLKYGKNKFNPKNAKDGFSQTALGEESVDALWSLSEFIPVVSGTTYSLTPKNTSYKRPTFHDVNYNFVELIHAGSNITPPMTYTPTQNGYVRIPVLTDGKYNFSFTITLESSTFEPFTIEGVDNLLVKTKPNSVGDEELKNESVTPVKMTIFDVGYNLFESSEVSKGKFRNLLDTSVVQSSERFDLYDSITPLEPGKRIYYKTFGTGIGLRFALFFDINGNFIDGEDLGVEGVKEWETIIPNSAYSLSITVGADNTSHVLSKDDYIVEGQSNYKIKQKYLNNLNREESALYGKRLVGFGDSIGQGGGNVVNGKGRGYIEMIAEQNYMTHKNYAIGGATIAKREGYEHLEINTQIDTAITDGEVADYIVFNGLTNDASATPISRKGEITDSYDGELDLNTFAGMFEEICRKLINNFTQTKIIYVRVHNMSSRGSQQVEYGELATEICKKYSIPVVDLFNEGGLNTQMVEMTNLYTNNADSTHPNELGYRMFYVPRIETKMMSV